MFERVLLPLDGSEVAETALPYGEEMARKLGSELVLFHACSPEHKVFSRMHEIYLSSMAETVQRHVKRGRVEGEVKIKSETVQGEPVDAISDYIDKNGISLVIMSSSGASGAKPGQMGGVVDKVIRMIRVPTLLTRPQIAPEIEGKKPLINRILVPLDGSEVSKAALPVAEELARKLKASITLFQMARLTRSYVAADAMGFSAVPVEYYERLDRMELRDARGNLLNVQKELRDRGVPVTNTVISGIDAANEIIEASKKAGADLIVMSTHGRSPIRRFVFGSVAEKVLRQGDLPLLLVRQATG